jgi:hypothetical protein
MGFFKLLHFPIGKAEPMQSPQVRIIVQMSSEHDAVKTFWRVLLGNKDRGDKTIQFVQLPMFDRFQALFSFLKIKPEQAVVISVDEMIPSRLHLDPLYPGTDRPLMYRQVP